MTVSPQAQDLQGLADLEGSYRNGKYDLVTLDMGFTLVDLHSGFDRELLAIVRQAGYTTLTLDDVHAAMRAFWAESDQTDATRVWQPSIEADQALSLEIDRQICIRLGVIDPVVVAAANRRSHELFNDLHTYTVYPDVFETLEALRRTAPRLGVLSNWGWHLPELCQRLGLASYFDFIVTSARIGANKPNARIFHAALQAGNTEPSRMLHVGDNLRADVRGAQALGITGVLLDRKATTRPDGYPVVCDLRDVLALL